MELNKTIQELKMEVETIKKTQRGTTLEIGILKEIRKYRCKHQQQNTRNGRENLSCRIRHIKHGHNNKRKCKMLKEPNTKHSGNPRHTEKTKPKDNRSRGE
jgi:FtsZ-binding cell division protein ZapB